ncbi:MAG: hypothetical protein IPG07_08740 [Crocinitomicaceae bacterium]|nr:hypothetical protein [Crocinitomicaceae bacterium]
MKNIKSLATVLILASSFYASAQYPDNVNVFDAKPNEITTVSGSLDKGAKVEDLTWASYSSVACFPATQNSKFTGNHVFHAFQIPKYAEVKITLTPTNKDANLSLYGYQVATNNFTVVPDLTSCVSCEADYKWDAPRAGKTQDHTRSITFNSTTKAYNIFIGVAGANGLTSGDYTLTIDLKAAVENTTAQAALTTYNIKAERGKTLSYQADLSKGTIIQDLSWAANSSVACFPATQNAKFSGNHIFFVTEIPAQSEMTITLIPDDVNSNMSIYAFTVGTTSTVMVPELTSCVSCEADHKWDYPKKGKTQDHTRSVYLNATTNPYRVVIGVAGAEGLMNGTFVLDVALK